jgi:competence protein ComEA
MAVVVLPGRAVADEATGGAEGAPARAVADVPPGGDGLSGGSWDAAESFDGVVEQAFYRASPVLQPVSPAQTGDPPEGFSGGGPAATGDGWLAPGGPALTWDDLLPGWPEDVTLDPGEARTPAVQHPAGGAPPSSRAAPGADELATRPPWAPENAVRRPLRPPALFGPASPADDEEDTTEDDDQRLSGAGAFGGAAPSRLGAFDPGRRGVRALVAVAIVVVVIAAFLAWRARPRVDPVAPPGIDPAAADVPLVDGSSAAGGGPPGTTAAAVVVAVGGKVRKPGLVELPAGARVADALKAAGGASPGVDVAPLNLARKVADGELIMVGVTPPPGAAPTGPAGPAAGPGQPGGGLVNLNTATLADLDTLPGVGPVLAQRILDAREAQGGFQAVTDLRNVQGIGTARYEQLKDLVTV